MEETPKCFELLKNGNYCHALSYKKNGYCDKHMPSHSKEEKINKFNKKILESIPSLPFDLSTFVNILFQILY